MSPPVPKRDENLGQGEYDPNGDRSFNNWTRIYNDTCSYENSLRVGSAPMKYYVNEFNSPQVDPFETFSIIGNQRVYDVRNDYERPMPSRLNPIYQTYVEPYQTTGFLGNQAENRAHANTGTELRFGPYLRNQKSSVGLGEIDYNRWEPNVAAETVMNAGQFGNSNSRIQSAISRNGLYDPLAQNNVLVANSAYNRSGISSRNELHNAVELGNC